MCGNGFVILVVRLFLMVGLIWQLILLLGDLVVAVRSIWCWFAICGLG